MKRLFEHFLNTGEKNLGNNSIMVSSLNPDSFLIFLKNMIH